jgi:Zn-dependent oligopeptidase
MSNNPLPNLNITADEIINETNLLIKHSTNINNKIANLKIDTGDDVNKFLELLSDDINKFQIFHSLCSFLQYVSPDEKVRNASFIADLTLSKYVNELNLRKDIYDQLIIMSKNDYKKLDPIDIKFLNKLILNYERNGILLSEDKKSLLLKIKHEISKLENAITKYLNKSENDTMTLSDLEIKGAPSHFINSFEKINETSTTYKVIMNKNNYNLLMKYVNDSATRKKIESFCSNKYKSIVGYICKLIVLKDRYAKLLSYKCYSDYKAHTQMSKKSENIKNFLAELLNKLNTRYIKELDIIHKIANKFDKNEINSWDIQYYVTKWKQDYGINENSLKEYFEITNTIKQIFNLYEKLFNIKFIKIKSPTLLWHKDVITYSILDAETNKKIGYLYLDLYSRNGKYKQTRCFCLHPSCMYPFSKKIYQVPVSAIIASFTHKLLNFQDVISLFHEMGHVMHHIFSKTKYIILSGINVEGDFIETPAQILDLLCWEKDVIKELSSHYKTKQPLPDEIINKVVKLKNLDLAIHYKKYITIALLDQVMFSSEDFLDSCEKLLKSDTDNSQMISFMSTTHTELYNEIMDNKINLNPDVFLPIEWIYSLYDCETQYYSTIWSRVLSSDMYNEKIKNNTLNKNIGDELRDSIFMHGGTKPAYDMICDYIKRKPAIDGFISMHSLDTEIECSFYLTTDQIKTPQNHVKIREIDKQIVKSEEDEASNKFSEVNESSINFEEFEK